MRSANTPSKGFSTLSLPMEILALGSSRCAPVVFFCSQLRSPMHTDVRKASSNCLVRYPHGGAGWAMDTSGLELMISSLVVFCCPTCTKNFIEHGVSRICWAQKISLLSASSQFFDHAFGKRLGTKPVASQPREVE